MRAAVDRLVGAEAPRHVGAGDRALIAGAEHEMGAPAQLGDHLGDKLERVIGIGHDDDAEPPLGVRDAEPHEGAEATRARSWTSTRMWSSGSRSASRAASSSVPSLEPASTISTSAAVPMVAMTRFSASTVSASVPASLRVGMTIEVSRLIARRCARGPSGVPRSGSRPSSTPRATRLRSTAAWSRAGAPSRRCRSRPESRALAGGRRRG